jgi:hypothetical protein
MLSHSGLIIGRKLLLSYLLSATNQQSMAKIPHNSRWSGDLKAGRPLGFILIYRPSFVKLAIKPQKLCGLPARWEKDVVFPFTDLDVPK